MDITLNIDGTILSIPEGSTILEAGLSAGIKIPTICFHEATTSNALCRICVVEVEGQRLLQPACIVRAGDGMKIKTRSVRVDRVRRTILEMLAASIDLQNAPDIQDLIIEYGASIKRFPEAEARAQPIIDDNPMYIRDYSKCILCWRCVQVCADDAQYTNAINFRSRGFGTQIATFLDDPMQATTCVFCGQCVGVCPTGALKPKREFLLEKGMSPDQISEESSLLKTGRNNRRKEKKE